jgi:hypothetical protein
MLTGWIVGVGEIGMIKTRSLWILLGVLITTGIGILEIAPAAPLAYLAFAWVVPATFLVFANLYVGTTDD